MPEPKADKRALFEAATKDADEPKGEAITQKAKKAEKKADDAGTESPAAAEPTEA